MDKIVIKDEEWIRLHDICDIMRHVSEQPIFENTGEVIDQIARLMFYDELQKVKDEIGSDYKVELPGDFIVARMKPDRSVEGFIEWKEGKPALGSCNEAMVFKYASMADDVAGKLGKNDGWRFICIGKEDSRITKRIIENLKKAMDEAEGEADQGFPAVHRKSPRRHKSPTDGRCEQD